MAKHNTPKSGSGYCNPPKHSQFKPGQSGNPHGRPKGRRNMKTRLTDILLGPIRVREGERQRTVSKLEGVLLRQVEGGLRGNERAALAIMKVAAQLGLLHESQAAEQLTLSKAEQRMVDDFAALLSKAQKTP